MQQSVPTRIVVYAKDIVLITGRTERSARRMIAAIRKRFKKKKGDMVSVDEFCEYTGLREDKLKPFFRN